MDELKPDRISRRRMLKRIAAGTAVAWSAPVLTSLARPAFAQNRGYGRCPTCAGSPEQSCVSQPECGDPATFCTCLLTTEGDCFCHTPVFCSDVSPCDDSTDCGPGFRCAFSCCVGKLCIPECSLGAGVQPGGGLTTAG